MRELSTWRVPAMTRADRTSLGFLTSTHVVDDPYQRAVPGRCRNCGRWVRQGVRLTGYQPAGAEQAWEHADEIVLSSRRALS